MDAHNKYEKDYILKCISYLSLNNVGGISMTIPLGNSLKAISIVIVLSAIFGAGNAYFRIDVKKPVLVDTVPITFYLLVTLGIFVNLNYTMISTLAAVFRNILKK